VHDKQLQAHQAGWSQNHGIVVLWFDGPLEPSGLNATDAAGHVLPAGRSGAHHG
jgi:hypothetical protein